MSSHESSVDPRVLGAAHRHGADVTVWRAVHDLHIARARVAVITRGVPVLGYIVQIDDVGFRLDHGARFQWPDVERVERVDG